MIRDIVEIDEAKCDGCGQCIPSCAEGALYLDNGKVKLRADALCDGLGACLGECPQGALRVVKRDASDFDEHAVAAWLVSRREMPVDAEGPAAAVEPPPLAARGCPGSAPRTLHAVPSPSPAATPARPRLAVVAEAPPPIVATGGSRLGQWPVQISLVSPGAPYLEGADLLIAADCVPFAYARFHDDFLAGRRVLVGCPKLDDLREHAQKLTAIFSRARPRSVTVVKMQVPCCNGIAAIARQALALSASDARYEEVTIGIDGSVARA